MGYKLLGNQCSKYLWMSSKKIRDDEILLCRYMLLTVNELEESCFIKLIAYSKNISIYSYSSQIPWGRQQQPPECFSVLRDLIRCWVFQPCFCSCCPPSCCWTISLIPVLLTPCAQMGSAVLPSELSLLLCSCVSLHSGVCGLQAAQVSLLCAPLVLLLLLSGVSAPGSWLQI